MDTPRQDSSIEELAPKDPALPPDQADFYKRLRERVRRWSEGRLGRGHVAVEYVMAGPDIFHLLCRLMLDGSVAIADKAVLGAAIAYYMTPLDIIPELILGPTGFVDDIALAAYVLRRLLRSNPDAVRRHWAGERDIVEQLELLLDGIDRLVGAGRWNTILRTIRRQRDGAEQAETRPN